VPQAAQPQPPAPAQPQLQPQAVQPEQDDASSEDSGGMSRRTRNRALAQ